MNAVLLDTRRTLNVPNVLSTSYVRLIYVPCPGAWVGYMKLFTLYPKNLYKTILCFGTLVEFD